MTNPPDDHEMAPVTRRSFVSMTGAFVGIGASNTVLAGDDRATLTAGSTAAYHSLAAAIGDRLDMEAVDVSVGPVSDDWDVAVTGRPTLSNQGPDAVGTDGWALLEQSPSVWRECLGTGAVQHQWRRDHPTELWIEADQDTPAETGRPLTPAPSPEVDGGSTPLVYGTRSYQYAQGQGGAGYYRVAPETLHAPASTTQAEATLPVRRVSYLHVSVDTRTEGAVTIFHREYEAATATLRAAPGPV